MPDSGFQRTALVSEQAGPPPRPRRIYCNRNLRLDSIDAVGFDMDYTLALYRQDEIDRLSLDATVGKMIAIGYPEWLKEMKFTTDFPIRGLIVDKELGNILKLDSHRYVKKAYHGHKLLSIEERRRFYQYEKVKPGNERYHWVDTLYALSEVELFAACVDAYDKHHAQVDYQKLFLDIRTQIDLAHQDGSILDVVLADLPRFTMRDPNLGPTFHKFRSSGKKLFLLTNSNPRYTDAMMNFLLGKGGDGYPTWRNYFDAVITAARKPSFFGEGGALFEVDAEGNKQPAKSLERGKIYSGGNIRTLEELLKCAGDRVLYVGDHIYGDVLRAKKESAWRTAMIIQEMDRELKVFETCRTDLDKLDGLAILRERLLDEITYRHERAKELQRQLEQLSKIDPGAIEDASSKTKEDLSRHRRLLEQAREQLGELERDFNNLEELIERAFHPYWGSLFMSGPELASFGDQVEEYACLYTDRVANFSLYSPNHYFRSARHRMPHEG